MTHINTVNIKTKMQVTSHWQRQGNWRNVKDGKHSKGWHNDRWWDHTKWRVQLEMIVSFLYKKIFDKLFSFLSALNMWTSNDWQHNYRTDNVHRYSQPDFSHRVAWLLASFSSWTTCQLMTKCNTSHTPDSYNIWHKPQLPLTMLTQSKHLPVHTPVTAP